MASIIKIKRNSTQGSVPSSLETGEIAVNLFDRKLYVGNTTGVTAIGGEDFRLTTDSPTSGDGAYLKLLGDSTLSTNSVLLESGSGVTVARQSNGSITFSVQAGTITNVQLQNDHYTISANTGTDTDFALGETVNIVSGDGTGITTALSANTITISGTDATTTSKGVASFSTTNFNVSSGAVSAKDITLNGDSGSAAATIGESFSISGTSNEIETSATGTTITIGLPDDVTVTGQLNVGENVVATGNADIGGVLSVDGATNLNTLTTTTIQANGAVTIDDTTSSTTTATGALIVDGGVGIAENLNVGGDVRVSGDTTIDGNLTVEGALTYISTSTVYADDGMFKLAANNAGDTVDTGIYAKYVVSGNSAIQYAGYFRDSSDGVFKFYTGLDDEPTGTVNTADTGYGLAQVDAIIDGGAY
jgi:hypothetical protein